MLYGLFLDRMALSQRNGWNDEQGRVYIIYTVENTMESLGCGNKKAIQLLSELENKANLILRKKQGLGKPNLIYLKKFTAAADHVDGYFLKCENNISGSVEMGEIVKLTDKEGNSYSYVIESMEVVGPYENSVKAQGKEAELTLITCENKGTMRLRVKCRLQEVVE